MALSTKKKSSRTTKKRPSSKKKAAARNSRSQLIENTIGKRGMLLVFIALACILAIITLFKLGAVGQLLFSLLSIAMGSFAYPCLILILIFGGWFFWTGGKQRVPWNVVMGIILLFIAWTAISAQPSIARNNPWNLLAKLPIQVPTILSGESTTVYGYAGAILAGMLTSLFAPEGSWLISICILCAAVALIGLGRWNETWEWSKQYVTNVKDRFNTMDEEEEVEDRKRSMSFFSRKPNNSANSTMSSHPGFAMIDIDEGLLESALVEGTETDQEERISNLVQDELEITPRVQKKSTRSSLNSKQEKKQTFLDYDESFAEEIVKEENKSSQKTQTDEGKESKSSLPYYEDLESKVSSFSDQKENKENLDQEEIEKPTQHAGDLASYKLPTLRLLQESEKNNKYGVNAANAREEGHKLIQVLDQFGVPATLSEIHIGPSVTKFEITLGTGVRVSAITNLTNDIKMALAATDIRIEAPIPGKSAVGIEVPNAEKVPVNMKDLMKSVPQEAQDQPLLFTLGKDLMGKSVYGRLDRMPHLLIAGATGAGKSVCVNSIICSILMRTRPDEVKLMLIDPKKVEFTPYDGVPHLMAPVITDSDMANKALKVVVNMMDKRYDLFEQAKVRNINAYNGYCQAHPDSKFKPLPRMVIVIDELADLMLMAAKEVEQSIQRITQLARAAGIHLIVATQRPSVNVITGVIKANIPSRIAFMVSSSTDSRTILDQAGAERLLGNGDMLFLDNGESAPRRIQGVFIQDEEVNRITEYVKKQALPMYDDAFITLQTIADQTEVNAMAAGTADPLYEPIRSYVIASQKASTSAIQRRFSVGYGKAARIIDALEANGIVGPANGSKPREVLVRPTEDSPQP